MTSNRRLIEDYIPIKEISAESAREKSIRKGHISTLHLWWARRPLVAARAAVLASLLAAPETYQKRTCLKKLMVDLCQWGAGQETIDKAKKKILEAQRNRLNLPVDTPLNEVPPPKVLDMFAGGGAIPLEALRLGCETYAVELNPVAHIIELCTLVYPQKYGEKLADEVEKWGNWVIENVRQEIGDLYPHIKVGEITTEQHEQLELLDQSEPKQLNIAKTLTPVAYLWTRTVKCPNPECGADVPLARQTWLCKKKNRYIALKVTPNHQTKKVEFEVVEAAKEEDLGFDPKAGSSRGTSTCRHCGTTVKSNRVKELGKAGNINRQLMAIVCTTPGQRGKTYLSATEYQQYIPDEVNIKSRLDELCEDTGLSVPNEPIFSGDTRAFFTHLYGLDNFGKLFTPRQLLALMTFVKYVREAHEKMLHQGYEENFAKAIATYLSFGITKVVNRGSSVGVWNSIGQKIESPVGSGRLPMSWDFPETNPIGSGSGNWSSGLDYTIQTLRNLSKIRNFATAQRQPSQRLSLPDSSLDAVVSDPPYYDNIPYSHLSDYFYVWFKRSIGYLYPEHFSGITTPKKSEAIVDSSRFDGDSFKAQEDYEHKMFQAFCETNRVLKSEGIMVVVYAHKTTAGWATLVDALRRAKFTITEAWPLDTEQQGGLRSLRASLASSIFLVARKRTNSEVGDYAMDVKPQLAEIVKERVKTLIEEGVTGADLIIACIGAGLKAYTQFDRVELPNGDELDAQTFLDEVQKTVLDAVLTDVLHCDKKGISAVDKPTQYYILGRYEYGEAAVEFDEANTLARGVGVELDGVGGLTDGKHALVKKTKKSSKVQIQLRNYKDRGNSEDLGILKTEKQNTDATPNLIDILHRLLWLAEYKPQEIPSFLILAQPDASQLRLVAQALAGRALTSNGNGNGNGSNSNGFKPRTQEQQAIDTLLASWKRLVEENLFTVKN